MTDVDVPDDLLPDGPVVLGEVDLDTADLDAAIDYAERVEDDLLDLRDEVGHDLEAVRDVLADLRDLQERRDAE